MKARGARAQTPARCRALQELAKIVGNGVQQHEIAVECDVSKSTVTRWLSRECEPSDENKATMKRKWGIELSWWAQPELTEAAAAPPAEDLEKLLEITDTERLQRYRRIVDQGLVVAEKPSTPLAQKMALAEKGVKTLMVIKKSNGELRDLSESQIVKHRAWARLMTKLERALFPYTAEEFEKMQGEERMRAEVAREMVLRAGYALKELDEEDR